MEHTLYDSDLNEDKLNKLIAEKPELEILKYLGEFEVEVDASLTTEDNRFDAPYQEGWVTGGSIDQVVDEMNVYWSLDESILPTIEELLSEGAINQVLADKVKALVNNEPKSALSYDLVEAITQDAWSEIEQAYVEKHGDND